MKFKFNPKNHRYTLDGKPLTGVTTIIGIIDKSGPLMTWAVNETIAHLKKVPDDYEGAKGAWRKKRDKAGDVGTAVHNAIEEFAKTGEDQNLEDPKAQKMYNKFIQWTKDENIKILLSEQRLYSKEYWYAGTCDLVFEKDGKKYIGDIKTAKAIYLTNWIQMAGYDICLNELDKVRDLEGYCVINIPKEFDKDGEPKLNVEYKYERQEFINAFLAALDLYRFVKRN